MGKKALEIIRLDINDLIQDLNRALADEWYAYYQYWIGAQVVKGPIKEGAIAELTQHAADELRHAQMLTQRILQLDGIPVLNPNDWSSLSTCGYLEPKDFLDKNIIEQGIQGERCAIDVYDKLLQKTQDKDVITYHIILEILKDEIDHEEDFEALLEDYE